MVIIKGHEIETVIVKNAHNRRAMQLKNNIIMLLRSIGVNENDIDVPVENVAIKKAKASATWYYSAIECITVITCKVNTLIISMFYSR